MSFFNIKNDFFIFGAALVNDKRKRISIRDFTQTAQQRMIIMTITVALTATTTTPKQTREMSKIVVKISNFILLILFKKKLTL